MLKTKLLKLLGGLSPEGINELRIYLFKGDESTAAFRIFTYIVKYHPDFEQNKAQLTREKVFKECACKSYNYMYGLCSNLCRDIEGFMIHTELKEDSMLQDMLLNRAYAKRGLDEFFEKHNNDTREKILKAETPEQSYYHTLFRLSYNAAFHRNNVKLRTEYRSQLKEAEAYLDAYYLLYKLRILCECKTLAGIIDIEKTEETKKTEESKKTVEKIKAKKPLLNVDYQNFIREEPDDYLISLYAKTARLYDEEDPQIYTKLREEIEKGTKPVDAENLSTLLVFLINFCSRKSKENIKANPEKDTLDYTKEIFDLYEFAFNEDLLKEDGYIPEIHYLSLVKVAVANGNFELAQQWIHYAKDIKPEYQKNGRKLATAILHFAKGKYSEAQTLLQEIKWRNKNYKVTSRDLLTKIYYEIKAYKLLNSHISNVRKAIQRDNDLPERQKRANYNFFNVVKELAEYEQELKKDKSALPGKTLLSRLEKHPMVYGEWCRKKFKELTAQFPARQA